jgi:hypothetical protein
VDTGIDDVTLEKCVISTGKILFILPILVFLPSLHINIHFGLSYFLLYARVGELKIYKREIKRNEYDEMI